MNEFVSELFLEGYSIQEIKEQLKIPLYRIRDILVEEGLILLPDIENRGFLYAITCNNKIKIGRTRNVNKRVQQLQTGNPEVLKLFDTKFYNNVTKKEKELHEELKPYCELNEWFTLNQDVLIILKKYF